MALENCFLTILNEKKKHKNLKKFAVIFGMVFLLFVLLCAFESNIKDSPCDLVMFIRNVIVNIIAGEFPDLSAVL